MKFRKLIAGVCACLGFLAVGWVGPSTTAQETPCEAICSEASNRCEARCSQAQDQRACSTRCGEADIRCREQCAALDRCERR